MCGVKGRVRTLAGEVDEAFGARKGPSCLWRQGRENPPPVDPDPLYLAPPSIPAWLWDKGLSPSTKPSRLLQASSGAVRIGPVRMASRRSQQPQRVARSGPQEGTKGGGGPVGYRGRHDGSSLVL